jgi:hypothetical protein
MFQCLFPSERGSDEFGTALAIKEAELLFQCLFPSERSSDFHLHPTNARYWHRFSAFPPQKGALTDFSVWNEKSLPVSVPFPLRKGL